MKTKSTTLTILLFSLLLVTAACSLINAQLDNGKEVLVDEIAHSEAGGYEFQPLTGYETKEYAGNASMFLPGGDQQSGPGMLMTGSVFDRDVSIEQAIAVLDKFTSDYAYSEAKAITIDNIEGVYLDFTTIYHAPDGIILDSPGADEGEQIQGRMIIIMVKPRQQFKCVMLAPAKSWKEHLSGFEKVIGSLNFFDAKP